MQPNDLSIVDRLKQQHRFPGPFMFKAIGPNDAQFVAQVTQSVVVVLGVQTALEVSTLESSHGKHVSVTVRVQVHHAQQVVDIWALMARIGGVKMVM